MSKDQVFACVGCLDAKEREVVKTTYANGRPREDEQVGQMLGMRPSEVRFVRLKALAEFRNRVLEAANAKAV